jgi:hypothetical protein
MDVSLPPCGLYRTVGPIGSVPAGRLVYFHNHGNPGPGVYLPVRWTANRAHFGEQGVSLPDPSAVRNLAPLAPEGFYRVVAPFHCCEKRCRLYEPQMLVQLGYDAEATSILFVPEIVDGVLALPQRGLRIEPAGTAALEPLKVPVRFTGSPPPTVH